MVYLTYTMKSGRTVVRGYFTPTGTDGYQIVRRYLYNTSTILGFTDAVDAAKRMEYMYGSFGEVPPALYEKLLIALQEDCVKGHVSPDISSQYMVEYHFTDSNGVSTYRNLGISASASIYCSVPSSR